MDDNIVSAILLEILATMLIFIAISSFALIGGWIVIRHLNGKPSGITLRRRMQIYFWGLVILAIGFALKSFSHAVLVELLTAYLWFALAALVVAWAKREWRKLKELPAVLEIKELHGKQTTTMQADDDDEWLRSLPSSNT